MSQVKYNGGNQSSILDKLPQDLRARLHQEIASNASLARCHKELNLASHGVSRSALYRYARGLKKRAERPPAAPDLSNLDAQRRQAILDSWSVETAHYRRRRAKAEDILIEHIMEKLEAGPYDIDDLAKLAAALARFKREDNAADRITATVHIAKLRRDSEISNLKSEISNLKSRNSETSNLKSAIRPQRGPHGYEPDAPWGRKADGTPYTQDEFNAHLKRAMKDIYNLTLTDEHFQPYTIMGDIHPEAPGDPLAPGSAGGFAAPENAAPSFDAASDPSSAPPTPHSNPGAQRCIAHSAATATYSPAPSRTDAPRPP